MDYTIVNLEEMHITGLATRTSNTAPDMGAKIGGLWQRLYGEGILDTIPGRTNGNVYGVYTGYENGVEGEYDVLTGAATEGAQPGGELRTVTIPAGRYAKFSIITDRKAEVVGEVWQDIWNTPLDRAFTADFEEYPAVEDTSAPLNLYIALKG